MIVTSDVINSPPHHCSPWTIIRPMLRFLKGCSVFPDDAVHISGGRGPGQIRAKSYSVHTKLTNGIRPTTGETNRARRQGGHVSQPPSRELQSDTRSRCMSRHRAKNLASPPWCRHLSRGPPRRDFSAPGVGTPAPQGRNSPPSGDVSRRRGRISRPGSEEIQPPGN